MRREHLLGQVLMGAWLAAFWVALWGSVTPANIVTGIAVATAVMVAVPPLPMRADPLHVHPLPALSFCWWFVRALVVSNLAVAREVLVLPSRSRIRPAIVAVGLRTESARLTTIIANAITLTPGTLTVDARGRPAGLFVHVLSFSDPESSIEEVADLERRVVDAFGSPAERARICGRPLSKAERVAEPDGPVQEVEP